MCRGYFFLAGTLRSLAVRTCPPPPPEAPEQVVHVVDGHLLPGAPAAGHGDEEGGAGHRGATSQVLQVRQVVPEQPPPVQEGPEGRRLQGRIVQVGVEQDVLEDLGAEAVDAPELGLPQHEGLVVHRAEELQQGPGIEVGGVLHPHRDDGAGQEERAGRFQDGELLLHLDPVHVQVRDDRGRPPPAPPPRNLRPRRRGGWRRGSCKVPGRT